MKKYIYLSIIISALFACTDQLNQVNPNTLTEEIFWKSEADALSALAGTYKVFKDINDGYWAVRGVEVTNGRGDDFHIRNDVKALYQITTYSNDPSNGVTQGIFNGAYNGIFRANQIIEKVSSISSISDEKKTELIAEAKFIRGLNYFNLVINFGGVPIHIGIKKSRSDYPTKTSKKEEVWAVVESDFKDAKEGLPASYDDNWVGRATKGAAIGYLGKTYLYQKKWAEAQVEFKLLCQPDGMPNAPYTYDLLTDFAENFGASTDNNKESLFEIQNQDVGGTNPWTSDNGTESMGVTTAQEFAPGEVNGWFEVFPTDKMLEAFQKEKTNETPPDFDPRMKASIAWVYPDAPMFYQKPIGDFFKTTVLGEKCKIKKYQNWKQVSENNPWRSEINEKCLRYADILLMYAEALAMDNKHTEAYPLINRIRTRAKLATFATGKSQQEVMEEIKHQRMVEFFREGLRFYDLRRWGDLQKEIGDDMKEGKHRRVGAEFFLESKHSYFPIPLGELNTNPLATQNAPW